MTRSGRIPAVADTPAEVLYAGRWLTLKQRGHWEFVERNNPQGAVIIIAVTPEDRVLFVEQFRVPIRQFTIEMPAGLIGDQTHHAAEDAAAAARREILEETGYRAGRIEYLMEGPSSAGMSNEVIAFVRAYDLVREHAGGGDHTEDIVVHEVPRAQAGAWLVERMRAGYSIDPKLFAGLYLLEHGEALFAPRR